MDELQEYIEQKEQWLNFVLKRLGWTIEGLKKDRLTRCPCNPHHYVLDDRVEGHSRKCGQEKASEDAIDTAATIHITPSLQAAVLTHVKMEQDNINLQQQQAVTTIPTSLVDESLPPNDVFSHGPLHIISYIKSWKLVPKMFAVVNPAFLKTADVKGWLFKNLPRGHAHNTVIGGEVHVVDSILNCLMQPREGRTVDPDSVVLSTQQLLGGNTTSFILELWRFLSISSLQEQHNIPNSVVNELAPLPLLTKPQVSQRFPSHMIQAAQQCSIQEAEQHQGVGLNTTPLSVDDRRAIYDFVVEAAGKKSGEKTDDLYRDDFNPKLQKDKQGGDVEMSSIEMLARHRDYKRRRQTYRAKNVHITKRSTVEVIRDVINARMTELVAQLQEDNEITHQQGSSKSSSRDPHVASHDSRRLSEQSTNDKHHKHRSRSRSRSYDAPTKKGSIGDDSQDLDSSSHDLKHSDKHHRSHSHKHRKSQSRSHSRERKHKRKHKHKHKHVKD